ncbi:MAG TPA: hypothetical protein VMC09_12340, partial [Anaerolineales bacterium]|nr:hypothetical protein [Anaerolineales bacterium]
MQWIFLSKGVRTTWLLYPVFDFWAIKQMGREIVPPHQEMPGISRSFGQQAIENLGRLPFDQSFSHMG